MSAKQRLVDISARGDQGWYKRKVLAVCIGDFAVHRTPMFYREWRVSNATTGFTVKNFYSRGRAVEAARRLSSVDGYDRLAGMSMQQVERLAKHKPEWFHSLERRSKKALRPIVAADNDCFDGWAPDWWPE